MTTIRVGHETRLETRIGELTLPSPLIAAAGSVGLGERLDGRMTPAGLGAVVTRTITRRPVPDISRPSVPVASGCLVPLEPGNPGLDGCLERLPALRRWAEGRPVLVSIAPETAEEAADMTLRLGASGLADGLELQVTGSLLVAGRRSGAAEAAAYLGELVAAVSEAGALPVWVRLPAWAPGLSELAVAAESAGASALVVADPPRGMVCHAATGRVTEGVVVGPAIRPIMLRLVWEVSGAVSVPVIGGGGVDSTDAALEYLLMGARAVALGSILMSDPESASRIAPGVAAYCAERGVPQACALGGQC